MTNALKICDEEADRIIGMAHQSNIFALDKTLDLIRKTGRSYQSAITMRPIPFQEAARYCASVGERMCRAVHEVGALLPDYLR